MKKTPMQASPERGFILIAVSLALAVLAALMLGSSQFAGDDALSDLVADEQLEQLSQAALKRSRLQWQRDNCSNYKVFSDEALNGAASGSFSASTTPTSGSPVRVDLSVGSGGTSRSIQLSGEILYQWPDQSSSVTTATQGFDNSIRDGIQDELNYGISNTLRLQNQLGEARTLISFDLSGISANAEIISATLQLTILSNGNSGAVAATVHRLTRNWLEGTMDGAPDAAGSSWQKYNGGSGWNNSGGDYSSGSHASLDIAAAYTGAINTDITSLVAAWVKGHQSNQGMIIVAESGTEALQFASGEHSNSSSHPQLSLEWRCPCDLSC